MRLIDAFKARVKVVTDDLDSNIWAERINEYLDSQPTVEAEPIKSANWVWDKDGMDWNIGAWKCSCCHSRSCACWDTDPKIKPLQWAGSKYCSNCGAKMEEEKV